MLYLNLFVSQMGLEEPVETVTLNPVAGSGSTVFTYTGGYYDRPASRSSASSPASSVASLSTPGRTKGSAPQKARRKTDKVCFHHLPLMVAVGAV